MIRTSHFQSTSARLSFIALSTAILLQCARHAQADTETPRVKLGQAAAGLAVGPGMNAAGKDLRGSVFIGQNLTGAVFDRCDLHGVRIFDCNLSRASFVGAKLTGADIGECRIDGADFTDAIINGIARTDGDRLRFTEAQIKSTRSYKSRQLSNCEISAGDRAPRFDFRAADLTRAALGGDFTRCDFADARIHQISIGNGLVTFRQLASTHDFKQRRSFRVAISGRWPGFGTDGKWDFSGIDLRGSTFDFRNGVDLDFTDADIARCTITGGITAADLCSTKNYKTGNLVGINLRMIDLSECDLSGVNLTESHFAQCKFDDANLEDAVITGADFGPQSGAFAYDESTGLSANQIKTTWNYKRNRMAGIVFPKEVVAGLRE
jgi:uncharacterized protein YjbI with pentapeptide repeats